MRLWCGLRTWARGGEYTGEWTGKVLTEGAEGRLAVSDAKAAPRIVTAPSETIDPMRDFFASAGEHDVPEKPDRPVAPPAFPSIPVGMAIQNDQISQAEVATVLQGVTPGGSRETFQPEPAQDIPAPEAAPGYSTALYAGAGILVGLLALTGGIIVCAGVVVIATW